MVRLSFTSYSFVHAIFFFNDKVNIWGGLAWISFHRCRVMIYLLSSLISLQRIKCYIIWIQKHISRSDVMFLSLKVIGIHECITQWEYIALLALTGVLSGVLFVNFTVKRLFNHKLLNLKMFKLIQIRNVQKFRYRKK